MVENLAKWFKVRGKNDNTYINKRTTVVFLAVGFPAAIKSESFFSPSALPGYFFSAINFTAA